MNDKILRMEYSYNSLGDKNFNLHFKKAFWWMLDYTRGILETR
jgi:hypothetical protein